MKQVMYMFNHHVNDRLMVFGVPKMGDRGLRKYFYVFHDGFMLHIRRIKDDVIDDLHNKLK